MELFITTFESVATLLIIGILGFLIIRKKILSSKILGFLSPLALEIALPSLVFTNIIRDFNPNEFPDWWQLPLWWGFFTVMAAGLTFVFMYISKKNNRSEFASSLFYQNGIFFPLAIIAGMYGSDSSYLSILFIFTVFYPAFFFTSIRFFYKTKTEQKINIRKIFHPVLIVTILAILLKLLSIGMIIPELIISTFSLVGGMTVPLLMIILGGNFYIDLKKTGEIKYLEISKFVIIKNIVFPLIFLIIIIMIKDYLSYHIALILMLQAAVPPVTAVPLLTERYGGDRAIVNQFLVSSFLCSLITIPIMISLFSQYY